MHISLPLHEAFLVFKQGFEIYSFTFSRISLLIILCHSSHTYHQNTQDF